METAKLLQSILVAATASLSFCQTSFADDSPFRNDWIVRLQAEKLNRQFAYKDATLTKIARVAIDYYQQDNPGQKTMYETLWCNDGKPIGMERKSEFKIPAGKNTKIQVSMKKETNAESEKAIADAILRISLDAYRARTAIVSIKVPQESFQGIIDELNRHNCIESQSGADEEDKSKMTFPIETVTNGPSKTLYYY